MSQNFELENQRLANSYVQLSVVMATVAWDLQRGEQICGYVFTDKTLLAQALQSATKDLDQGTGDIIQSDGNRRLAKVGLKVIEFVLAKEWFVQGLDHGDLDSILKTVVSKDYLCDIAQQRGLQRCLSMSRRQENIAAPPSTMKIALTALIGAVWLDSRNRDTGNMDNVKLVMQSLGILDWDFLNRLE